LLRLTPQVSRERGITIAVGAFQRSLVGSNVTLGISAVIAAERAGLGPMPRSRRRSALDWGCKRCCRHARWQKNRAPFSRARVKRGVSLDPALPGQRGRRRHSC